MANALWFRVLALCLALGLGGGYVWKRHKAAEAAEARAKQHGPAETKPSEAELFPSSKRGPVGLEKLQIQEAAPQQSTPPDPAVVLPSSKSGIFIPAPEKEEEPAPRPKVLPGSKSIDRILEPSEVKEHKQQQEP